MESMHGFLSEMMENQKANAHVPLRNKALLEDAHMYLKTMYDAQQQNAHVPKANRVLMEDVQRRVSVLEDKIDAIINHLNIPGTGSQ